MTTTTTTEYTSLELISSKKRDYSNFKYDLIIRYKYGLYDKPTPTLTKTLVKDGSFNQSGSTVVTRLPKGIYIKSLKFIIKFGGNAIGKEVGKISTINKYGITSHKLTTTHGIMSTNRDNTVAVEVYIEKRIILGIHSNTSPSAGFTDGHAWISYNDSNSIITYGLWPDDHPNVPDNGSGTDVRIGLENPAYGQYNRFYQLTTDQVKRWKEYSKKTSKWIYTHTCAAWASDAIYYVVKEDVDSDDIAGFETPRELSLHIIELEKKNKTSPSTPYIINNNDGSSF